MGTTMLATIGYICRSKDSQLQVHERRALATGGVPLVVLGGQRGSGEDSAHEGRRHRQRVVTGVAVGVIHNHAVQAHSGVHHAEGLLDVRFHKPVAEEGVGEEGRIAVTAALKTDAGLCSRCLLRHS
eukprot:EG_transcript_42002